MSHDTHLLKSFDDALKGLRRSFQHMGDAVVENVALATAAYLYQDEARALEAINRDLDIDAAFEKLRAECFDALLRFQPVARDLRLVMGIEHAVGNLERAGDHAKTIARHVIDGSGPTRPQTQGCQIKDMADLVSQAFSRSVTALVTQSPEMAKQVLARDVRIDAYKNEIFDAAMVSLKQTSGQAQDNVGRLIVATALERIGDHATNISEEVLFVSRGVAPGATRTGSGQKWPGHKH